MSSLSRTAHALQKEKTLTIPRHFIFFDTETKPVKNADGDIRQDFKLAWALYYRRGHDRHKELTEWQYISEPSKFWEMVFDKCQQKQRLWVIARNVVFDFTVCKGWQYLRAEGYKVKFFHNNGVCAIVTVKKGNKTIVFLDSLNWFTESIAKTGKRIGIPKMQIDFETCTMQELSDYCKNDVLIEFENFRLFIAFLQANAISRLCYTKASTAMAAYLFRHYHTPIYIHNNKEATRLERESYKGGRCECFQIKDFGHETFYILDVNSLYPYCMADNLFPTKYQQLLHTMELQTCRDLLETNSITAKVIVKTDQPVYAIKRSRTIFPVGQFETTLCSPELKYALDHNHILQITDAVIYEHAGIFSSYVKTMYALRQEFKASGANEYETICKFLLNSLYGKFGQKAENWVKIGNAPNHADCEEMLFTNNPRRVTRIRYLLGEIFELKGYTEAYNSFPAIAAHVTAFARVYLWELMKCCGHGNYVYCDTDSLIVNKQGLSNLAMYCNDTKLGKLKLEKTVSHLEIRGLKDYTADAKVAIKGIRKTAIRTADGGYMQESWPSFRGIFKTPDVNTYTVKSITKHLSREYTKGDVNEYGLVTPFHLLQT